MEIKGMTEAKQAIRNSTQVLAGTRGGLYSEESHAIKNAIERNADPSYKNSPAKVIALESASANNWQHSGSHHRLNIMSTTAANIRQYCENPKRQATLVEFTEADIQEQIKIFVDVLERNI